MRRLAVQRLISWGSSVICISKVDGARKAHRLSNHAAPSPEQAHGGPGST